MVIGLLLSAHLLCVNIAAGGPLLGAWLDWRSQRGDDAAGRAAKYLARATIVALLLGAGLGIAIGLLKWDATYRELWLIRLSYKLKWAILETLFSLVLLVAWWLSLRQKGNSGRGATGLRVLIALLAATNLLYHFPPLFSIAAELHVAGETNGENIGARAFRGFMAAPPVPALWIHVVLASLAAAGVTLLGFALRLQRNGEEQRAVRVAAWGARWALTASLLQLPVGLWTLSALPPQVQSQIMGQDAISTLLFVAAMLAAFWLIQDLFQIAFGAAMRPLLIRAMGALLVTVTLMTLMHTRARQIHASVARDSAIQLLPRGGP